MRTGWPPSMRAAERAWSREKSASPSAMTSDCTEPNRRGHRDEQREPEIHPGSRRDAIGRRPTATRHSERARPQRTPARPPGSREDRHPGGDQTTMPASLAPLPAATQRGLPWARSADPLVISSAKNHEPMASTCYPGRVLCPSIVEQVNQRGPAAHQARGKKAGGEEPRSSHFAIGLGDVEPLVVQAAEHGEHHRLQHVRQDLRREGRPDWWRCCTRPTCSSW